MVVLVLAGLLMALVPPLLEKGTDAARLRADTRRLVDMLQLARSHAIARSAETDFVIDLETRRYGIPPERLDGSIDDGVDVEMKMAEAERLAPRRAAVRFFPDGSASGAQIRLANPAGAATVQVDWLTGRVTARTGG